MVQRLLLAGSLLLGVLFSPLYAQAQNASVEKKASGRTTTPSVTPLRQGIIMRNGKLMSMQGKGYSPFTQTKTFPNGATLQPTGKLTMASGEVIMLNDGDRVDLQGNFTKSPVVLNSSTTVSGDTTGIGNQLMQAQRMKERQKLLQEKQRILQEKIDLLQKTVQNKPADADMKKLEAEVARLQEQINATTQGKQ